MASDKELIAALKEELVDIAQKDPSWRLMLGRESLSATELVKRLDNDKKFRKIVLKQSIKLAIAMVQKGKEKREGSSGSPQDETFETDS